MYKLKYSVSEKNYLDFNLDYLKNSADFKRVILQLRIALPVIGLTVPFMLKKTDNAITLIIMALYSIAIILFLPKVLLKMSRRRILKVIKSSDNGEVFKKTKLEINDEGIFSEIARSKTSYTWDGILELKEVNDCIYLYTASNQALILPDECIKDNKRQSLIEYIKDKI